jgi:hypothetical protein
MVEIVRDGGIDKRVQRELFLLIRVGIGGFSHAIACG